MEQFKSIPGVMPIIDKHIPAYSERSNDSKLPFYYVMPLAESAEKRIHNANIEEKIFIINELLHMLSDLHAQNIAHRDIKPANILYYNGSYVLSDFGLVFFNKKTMKTPVGSKIGAKWTISPQMERDATTADKFKADVYSMAKTIWMILTGDMKSFEGQYILNSAISLHQYVSSEKYFYPLEKILVQCTDINEKVRPGAKELEQKFQEWININNSWDLLNLHQWQEVQERLFPTIVPTHTEWHDTNDIVNVLNLLGHYNSQNHTFFPDGGGLDLRGASASYEKGCIELDCDGLIYIIKPKKLSFEFINSEIEWNYFSLETDRLEAISGNLPEECFVEELYKTSLADYQSIEAVDGLTKEEYERLQPRRIVRYLHGSFVMFHKNSIYNQCISRYDGEHEKCGLENFRSQILHLANKYKGETMITIKEKTKR